MKSVVNRVRVGVRIRPLSEGERNDGAAAVAQANAGEKMVEISVPARTNTYGDSPYLAFPSSFHCIKVDFFLDIDIIDHFSLL
jgi:hypothetical protein